MVQGITRGRGIDAADEIEVEKILPRTSAQRARFDLRQAEIAQGEGAEGPEKGSWNVSCAEHQTCLPRGGFGPLHRVPGNIFGPAEQEKAGEVLAVAFDRLAENPAAVDLGGDRRRDSGGVLQ